MSGACRHTGAFGASSGCAKCNAELARLLDDPRRYRGIDEERAAHAEMEDEEGYERLKAEVRRLRAMLYEGCPDCHCTLVEWHHTTECPKWDAEGNELPCTGKTEYCPTVLDEGTRPPAARKGFEMTEDKSEGAIARPLTEEADKSNASEGVAARRGPCKTIGEFIEWCLEPCSPTWLRTKISASMQAWGERCAAKARTATLDDHGILHGEAADAFLSEMERVRSPEEIAAHESYLDECVAVYKRSQPATCQRCDAACSVCRTGTATPKEAPSDPLLDEVKSLRSWRKEAEGLLREAHGLFATFDAESRKKLRTAYPTLFRGTEGK